MQPESPKRTWVLLAAIVVLSILTQGYAEGIINHGIQLPLIRMFAGDDAFAGDAMMTELKRTYTTAFYPFYGALARVVPITVLLRVSFVLYRALSVGLAHRFGRAVFGDEKTALFTAVLTSLHWLTFADDMVSDSYLTHGALAQVLTLFALALFAEGKVLRAIVVGGVLFHVHGMHATHLLVVLGVATLAAPDRRRDLGSLAVGSLLALLLIAPNLWWMRAEGVLGSPVPDGYIPIVRAWFPTHFWPSSWGISDWLSFLFPVLVAWPLARLAGETKDGGRTRNVALFAFAFAVIGAMVVEVHPSPFVIRLHPLRASWIVILAGAPFLARATLELFARSRDLARSDRSRRIALTTALALAFVVAFPMASRNVYGVTLAPALWAAALGIEAAWVALPIGAVALLVPALEARWSTHAFGGMEELGRIAGRFVRLEGTIALVPLALVMIALLVGARPLSEAFRRRVAALLFGLGALHLLASAAFFYGRHVKGDPHEWREVQTWAKENLAKGERVLVPLGQIGLRAFSDQVPAIDFQDGDLLLHSPSWVSTFVPKLELYGWKMREVVGFSYYTGLEDLDAGMTAADLRRVGTALGAKVAVRRTRWPELSLPKLFENDRYVVYRLE